MDTNKLKRISGLTIATTSDLLAALKTMDAMDSKLLVVNLNDRYHSLLSIGDIQRAIIANCSLQTLVTEILRSNIRVARVSDPPGTVRKMMLEFRTEFMPVLCEDGKLEDVVFWEELFSEESLSENKIDIPVVVMAGGKGTRLKPFSNVFPKPLFPLGDKTILETIIEKFHSAGCTRFLLSLNYKADLIRSYLEQSSGLPEGIEIFQETTPMGTAGSLRLIKGMIAETFFVSNCDIIVDTDYSEFVRFHREQKNELSLVAAFKHTQIPYGTVESGSGGQLLSIQEKPEISHLINAGLYLLEPQLLELIPPSRPYQITELIEAVRSRNGRVGVFPVSEKSWCDIGQWSEYRRTLEEFT